jgi:hypothetical protein
VVSLSCDMSLLSTTGCQPVDNWETWAGLWEVVRSPVVVQLSNCSYLGAKGPSGDGCAEPRLNADRSPRCLNSEFAFYTHSEQYPNVTTHFRILFHIFAAYFYIFAAH